MFTATKRLPTAVKVSVAVASCLALASCGSPSDATVAQAADAALTAHRPVDPAAQRANQAPASTLDDRTAGFVAALNRQRYQDMLQRERDNEGAFLVAAGEKSLLRYAQSTRDLAQVGHDVCVYSRANQDAAAIDSLTKSGFASKDAASLVDIAESDLCATDF